MLDVCLEEWPRPFVSCLMAVDLVAGVPGGAGGGAQDQPLRDLHPALRPQADALLTWRVVAVRGRHSRPMNPDLGLWGDVVDVEPLAGAPGLPMIVVFQGYAPDCAPDLFFGYGAKPPNAEFLQALGPALEEWSLGDPQSLQRILSAPWPVARGLRPVLVSHIPHTTLQSLASVNQTAACAGSAAGPPMVVKASAEGPPVVVEAKQTEESAEQEFRTYPVTNRKETAKGVGTDWNSMTWVARLELLKASPALAARTAPRSPPAAAAELEHTRKRHRSS